MTVHETFVAGYDTYVRSVGELARNNGVLLRRQIASDLRREGLDGVKAIVYKLRPVEGGSAAVADPWAGRALTNSVEA